MPIEATYGTEATFADDQPGKATSSQEVFVGEVNDVLIAPAVEDEPGTGAQVESYEGEIEIKPREDAADLMMAVGPVPFSAAGVAERRVTHMHCRNRCQHCGGAMLADSMIPLELGSAPSLPPAAATSKYGRSSGMSTPRTRRARPRWIRPGQT